MNLLQIVLLVIPIVLAVTLHEAAHGYVALHFGDQTAKEPGRITLNPLRHIDLFGTIILPLILVLSHTGLLFGYAKPVPVNFGALRNPRWNMLWVAAAGPATNFLLAAASVALLFGLNKSNVAGDIGRELLLLSLQLNILLAVFNMLPLPPLDGSKVLAAFLPTRIMRPFLAFDRYGMAILLLLLIGLPLISERTGIGFDIFGVVVQRPATWLIRAFLSLIGVT